MCLEPAIHKGKDWTGVVVNEQFTVLGNSDELVGKAYKYPVWWVQCACGNIYKLRRDYIISPRSKHCAACYGNHQRAQNSQHWKGCGRVPQQYMIKTKLSAERRGLEFSLDIKDMSDLLEKQEFKCALSGLEIGFAHKKWTASIDRIDSSGGYEFENVQWVHKEVNHMKMELPQTRFVELCKYVARGY